MWNYQEVMNALAKCDHSVSEFRPGTASSDVIPPYAKVRGHINADIDLLQEWDDICEKIRR